jgi:hypothetical protein
MMVSIDSLTFDLSDCSLEEQSENHRMWVNSIGVAHKLQLDIGPIDWPFDPTDSTAGAEYYRRQCEELGGAMLSLEVTMTAGVEALRGLFKYRAPNRIAMYYVGILWLPFQECRFQINVEAIETWMTGAREAYVFITEPDSRSNPPSDTPAVSLNSAEEPVGQLWSAPVPEGPSDNERYDEVFPKHPLSNVRRRLTEVMATLELDASLKSLTPFRIRRGWRFWR